MAGPYYTTDNYGVTKLTNQAPNFEKGDGTKPGGLANGAETRGVGGLPGNKKIGGDGNRGNAPSKYLTDPATTDPKTLDPTLAAGGSIDPRIIDILLATGAAGASGLAYHLYRQRAGKAGVGGVEDIGPGEVKSTGTDLARSEPKVTKLRDEEVIPREGPKPKPKKVEGPSGPRVTQGGQARTPGPANQNQRYLPDQPTNPRNLPVSKQGSVDAAYSTKAAQDAAAAKAVEGANPGRAAKAARLREYGNIFRRVVR